MDAKGKSGWGLPIIVAVGAFAYYCASLTFSTDPRHRRQAIIRRLHDGTSPLTLHAEGYSRAELLGAGVPQSSLSPTTPTSPAASPSASRRDHADAFDSNPDDGVVTRVLGSLAHVMNIVHAASETIVSNLRGRSASASLRDTKASARDSDGASRRATSSPLSFLKEVSVSEAAPLSSVRLDRAVFACRNEKTRVEAESSTPECSRCRTPGGATMVHVAALSAAVTRGYTEESVTCSHPLEVLRFLHEDGSRLSIMAESCEVVLCDGVVTTDVYVQRSLARARAAADAAKAYFKVKLSTAARNIATTVMESYVNAHVGPSPVILASFYLVAHGMAYTIQLQTHIGVYEERLPDLLYTAQSARLRASDSAAQRQHGEGGRIVCVMQADGSPESYAVEMPVDLVARAEAPFGDSRSVLTLTPRGGGGGYAGWSATVETRLCSSAVSATPPGTRLLLCDSHVSITLTASGADFAGRMPESLEGVAAQCACSTDAAAPPAHAYISPLLTLPLPPPTLFATAVCEHPHDPFVTLFISNDVTPEADVFEVDLRCVSDLQAEEFNAFLARLESLFLTPSHPQHSVNAAGQDVFAMEGLAAGPAETSLRLYGVRVGDGRWLVVRWLYADSAVFPRELEQYRRALVDEVLC